MGMVNHVFSRKGVQFYAFNEQIWSQIFKRQLCQNSQSYDVVCQMALSGSEGLLSDVSSSCLLHIYVTLERLWRTVQICMTFVFWHVLQQRWYERSFSHSGIQCEISWTISKFGWLMSDKRSLFPALNKMKWMDRVLSY